MRVAARNIEGVAAPFDQLHAKRKAFFADIIADNIERGLIIGVANPPLHCVLQHRYVAGQMHRAGIYKRIKIAALTAQIVGQCGRIA